eukprot:4517578-Alexandrium_andersonii.AAC.1
MHTWGDWAQQGKGREEDEAKDRVQKHSLTVVRESDGQDTVRSQQLLLQQSELEREDEGGMGVEG